MTISSRKIVETAPIVVDPNFFVPPNVRGISYGSKEYREVSSGESAPVEDVSGNAEDINQNNDSILDEVDQKPIVIPVPDNAVIVDQTIRLLKGGGAVVDVTIEIDTKAANIEVGLTKV